MGSLLMLDFNALRIFYTVAKIKNITKTAEKLFISQSIITNTLKKLQKDLHITLFKKDASSLSLTNEGEKLYLHTEQLFLAEQRIESYLASIQTKVTSNLYVGIPSLYEQFCKKDLLSTLKTEEMTTSYCSANSKKLIKMLDEKDIDFAIAADLRKENSGRYTSTFYKKHEIKLIIPKGHRLFGKEYFSPHDIHFEKMILKEKGSAVRHAVDNYCKKNQVQVLTVAELENLEALLSACLFEKSLTFLPDIAIDNLLAHNNSFSIAYPKEEIISYDLFIFTRNSEDYPLKLWAKISQSIAQCLKTKEK